MYIYIIFYTEGKVGDEIVSLDCCYTCPLSYLWKKNFLNEHIDLYWKYQKNQNNEKIYKWKRRSSVILKDYHLF